jgi:putative peptide modification system cyclase
MNAISVERGPTPTQGMPTPLLRTLAVCDLVDSTALTEQLGDRGAAELVHKLDRLTRDLLYAHAGREIDKTDGFLVMFERPIQAVAFALAYQRLLRDAQESEHVPLQARIGIHVGDVVLWENSMDDVSRGAKSMEVEGLVKPVAARLMSLALPGQVLLSGVAYTFALRAQAELGLERQPEWRAHGRYQFKGVAEPMTVYEVGEKGIAPLHRPSYSGKAHRELPWWRRPGVLALEIAVLIAAVAVPAYIVLRSPPAIAFADRDWVVVGDLNNLTGEATFNDSAQSAFRIGLEQSRYVNVLSDLKVRDTLALMQRDEKTRVDRTVGSEVAIREGARALILPTLAEIGGRVRFTAEVIDPHTQATVYTESADGSGADSVLPSLDAVGQKLRVRLGEALAVVSKESMPLDKAATKNLDALKAFALAQEAYDVGRENDALGLYQQAVSLDPQFALAHTGLARCYLIAGRLTEAASELRSALALGERLLARERFFIEATLASIADTPRAAIDKWKIFATLYPDDFSGQGDYPYYAWILANRYDTDMVKAAQAATSPKNPHPLNADLLLAGLFLGNERYADAVRYYHLVEGITKATRTVDLAAAYAAQRMSGKTDEALARNNTTGSLDDDISAHSIEAAIAADRGDLDLVWKILEQAKQEAESVNVKRRLEFREIELSLRFATGLGANKNDLHEFSAAALSELSKASQFDRTEIQIYLLFAAYLSAAQSDVKYAHDVLGAIGPEPRGGDYPILNKLFMLAEAEIARASGKPAEAVKSLSKMVDGSELFLTHVVLLDAHVAMGEKAAALEQAQWLATHRGRAYVEQSVNSGIPFSVIQTNIALLRSAELNFSLGNKEQAQRALAEFRKFYPNADQLPTLGPRVKAISEL